MQPSDLLQAPALIQTPRLRLWRPAAGNAGPLAVAFLESLNRSLPALGFIAWAQNAHDPDWAARFLERDIDDIARGELLVYYAFERRADGGDGAYVGRIDLHSWDLSVPRCEVGYVGEPRVSGRGLMREAVLACIELALSLGAVRVQALSEAGNLRALRFAEQALGLQREGVLRHYERDAQGRLGEQVMFARVREDAR
ncbi:MAG: hypothetical protein RL227_1298 [Pseudomonadota bacterium]|jgi:RimJ/RimL family protein N-acetyltransferase